ncbi:MAG: hypothetical protein NXH75_15995 [Halobacteriovoraceae bacterium]|nr:hypothetical protein [Halobacteriovoraceae bacterium]
MDSKLRHDLKSDFESIFDCVQILIDLEQLPEEAKEGLNLILAKKERLEKNLEKLFH